MNTTSSPIPEIEIYPMANIVEGPVTSGEFRSFEEIVESAAMGFRE